MLAEAIIAIALFAEPPTALPDNPTPLVSLDMPTGGWLPQRCKGRVFIRVLGDGVYYVETLDYPSGKSTSRLDRADRSQLLATLAPRRNDVSICGRPIVSADRDVPYSYVLSTVSMLHFNGFDRISLIDPTNW